MSQPPPSPPSGNLPPPIRPLRILLVEDHADSAAVLSRLLQRSGHDVHTASSVAEARQLAKTLTPAKPLDVVISDLGLPDGSGLELMRELRTNAPIQGIALSGYGLDSDRAASTSAGFARHLVKPVNPRVLTQALAELFAEPQR